MNLKQPSEKRRFAGAYLQTFDAQRAAEEIGRADGVELLASPTVQKELKLQRSQCDVCQTDIVRALALLAFGRANDCVKLVLQETPEVDRLDLRLLSEVKRNDKGTVEVKLIDRIRALEQLAAVSAGNSDCADAFFAAAGDVAEA